VVDEGGQDVSAEAAAAAGATLDVLFRRAGVRNAHQLALCDPPNRADFADGAPRRLTFAQADRAISAFAAKLRGFGLHADTVVGLQLPNTVESVVAFLGTLRAGMVAAPLPLLWRRQDMVAALGRAGAKAIVTAGHIGTTPHAEIAREVAAELFPIRQIAAFGDDLPDGVVPLDDVFARAASEPPPPRRPGDPAAHVAFYTFDTGADGTVAVPHDHARLLAAGAALLRETALAPDAPMLSTIPLTSFAGLTLALMPWLTSGGPLHLHHGFDADVFAAQASTVENGAVVLPGPAVAALAHRIAPTNRIGALWRGPLAEDSAASAPKVIDCLCRDETTLAAAARDGAGLPDPGIVAEAARLASPGVIGVGAYRFSQRALDAAAAAIDPAAMIAALPDAVLGNRLAGRASDPGRMQAELTARGLNPLIAGAFRARAAVPPSA
jgi:hypothetical protein